MHLDLGFLGARPANSMKCCHAIDGSLPPCLGDNDGSDVTSPIDDVGSGGLGLALLGGDGLGSPGTLNLGGTSTSI